MYATINGAIAATLAPFVAKALGILSGRIMALILRVVCHDEKVNAEAWRATCRRSRHSRHQATMMQHFEICVTKILTSTTKSGLMRCPQTFSFSSQWRLIPFDVFLMVQTVLIHTPGKFYQDSIIMHIKTPCMTQWGQSGASLDTGLVCSPGSIWYVWLLMVWFFADTVKLWFLLTLQRKQMRLW